MTSSKTNFLAKINELDAELADHEVHAQAKVVQELVATIAQAQIPATAPQALGFAPAELEQIMARTAPAKKTQVKVINQLFNSLRQFLAIHYGVWSVPNLTTARLIKDQLHIKQALEIMAGNALWSKALNLAGIATVATDSLEWAKTSKTGSRPSVAVIDASAPAAIERFAAVQLIICSWAPNFDHSDLEAVHAWRKYNPNAHLLFVGERNGATNSAAFWHSMHFLHSEGLQRINRSFNSFDFINEQIFELKHES
ncbi:SAM-dependent methyltransferase [Lactobacillus xylocopicola]|uniref:SAM-dependent methyltransferase n=1 Tax=Lactobacillus xylocopicola TaxID=2976676 RepID=A0ABN6SJQ4_9LACO|nr:SAM-dependent methyltransferase [Lactobacillus xylocopicola]BDR60520.1 hypothetical protein KIM322_07810 [Lactobacillus xylocopicola]